MNIYRIKFTDRRGTGTTRVRGENRREARKSAERALRHRSARIRKIERVREVSS